MALSSARAGCLRGDLEGGDDLALLDALAHQRLVAARAQRQRKGVEQDRLAGAGLAGEHGKPVGEIDVEPVDQDDVADGKSGEHGGSIQSPSSPEAVVPGSEGFQIRIIKDGWSHGTSPAVALWAADASGRV